MLASVRELVRRQGVVSLQEVALATGVPAEVARAMLQKWVDKGRIEALPTPPACSGCALCDSAPRELYRWREAKVGIEGGEPQSAVGCKIRRPSAGPEGPFQGQGADRPASQSSS